jgi:dihydroorotate dehydrogenase (NAD+) catalytic subunit
MAPIDLAPHNPYGLRLRNPVMAAAGCFGFGIEYARSVPIERLGAIVTHSISLHGRSRSRPPWLRETPAGVVSGGWLDRGLEYVLRRCVPVWATWRTPVILSVAGDFAAVAAALEGVEGIAGLELNLADKPAAAGTITAAVRAATQLPVLVKLPLHDDLTTTLRAAAAAGADAATLIAPPGALLVKPESGVQLHGRLSGPAIRPLALHALAEARAAVAIPTAGCGGVMTAEDAWQFLALGADAVQVGTALLTDPSAAVRIAEELG